jgi:hypothetical protein
MLEPDGPVGLGFVTAILLALFVFFAVTTLKA